MSKKNILLAVAALMLSLPLFVSSATVDAKSNGHGYVPYICDLSGHSSGDVAGFNSDIQPKGSSTSYVSGNFDSNNIKCDETTFCAARSPKHSQAVAPICAWGTCEYVDNNSDKDIFVPFRTSDEWSSFLNTAQTNTSLKIKITHSAIPTSYAGGPAQVTVYTPYDDCAAQQTPTPSGFGRSQSAQWVSPTTQTFTCHADAHTGSQTTIESHLNWTADHNGSWKQDFQFGPDITLDAAEVGHNGNHGSVIDIDDGESVVLSWTTHGSSGQTWTCSGSGDWDDEKSWTGGHQSFTPHKSGTYDLACKDNHGLTSHTSCTVRVKNKTGACGTDNGQTLMDTPTNLCAYGNVASNVTSNNNGWSWSCSTGQNCTPAQCHAAHAYCPPTPVDGQCGKMCGDTATSKPETGLCQTGTASAVTGNGPWSWTCSGSNGGKTVQCSVNPPPVVVDGNCGSSNGMTTSTAPTNGLCSSGTASNVTGNGPWSWNCTGSNGGKKAYCSATPPAPPPPTNGYCGPTNGTTVTSTPTTGLCSGGTATAVSGNGPWTWSCVGANGGCSQDCSANPPAPHNGECGPSNSITVESAPTTGLCSVGMPTAVTGGANGPWSWNCIGTNGGQPAYCSANPVPPTNGDCGPKNGMTLTGLPTTGLCNSGTATAVTGGNAGPWSWNCIGAHGGTTAYCSAVPPLPPVNGICGSAVSSTVYPTGNLCSSGVASGVSGTGPWTWTCSGTNGGSGVSCSASPPAAPPVSGDGGGTSTSGDGGGCDSGEGGGGGEGGDGGGGGGGDGGGGGG